jgi:hypothetical protein
MDYSALFAQQLTNKGVSFTPVYHCFESARSLHTGWSLRLPDFDTDILLLHFQDLVNIRDGRVLELEQIEQRYGSRADRVIVTYWNHGLDRIYTGPVRLVEFSNHNYDLVNQLYQRWPEWQHIVGQPRTQAWQCLNGRMCDHRNRVVQILKDWPGGTLSYHDRIPLPMYDYTEYTYNNVDNFINLDYVYSAAAVNVVTETEYNTAPGIISEKTLLAMAAEQIPVVIGHAGIVKHCEELGFDMFTDLVDTSYDSLRNDVRAEQAILLNQDLIQGRIDLAPYRERLSAQREFLLDDYATIMELRFDSAISNLNLK